MLLSDGILELSKLYFVVQQGFFFREYLYSIQTYSVFYLYKKHANSSRADRSMHIDCIHHTKQTKFKIATIQVNSKGTGVTIRCSMTI